MSDLLLVAAQRFYAHRPGQLALAILGIALGVAVYVGVALANDSARRAFDLASTQAFGATSHQILPIDGTLGESLFVALVLDEGIAHATPLVETVAEIEALSGREWRVLGVDALRQTSAGTVMRPQDSNLAIVATLLTVPGAVLAPPHLASALGISRGDTLPLRVEGRFVSAQLSGLLANDSEFAQSDLLIADISTVQEWLQRPGALSRIDLDLEDEEAAALEARLPSGTTLVPTATRQQSFRELRDAFHINLMALGLLALFVGIFLVHTTLSFAVVQRRPTLGILQALGVSRRELLRAVLVEALVLGGVATMVGLGLGHLLADRLVGLVVGTIDDLRFRSEIAGALPSPWIYAQGAIAGIGASLFAGLAPALEAARTAPQRLLSRASLERGTISGTRARAWLALVVCLAAFALLAVSGTALLPAFAALFLLLLATILVLPAATRLLMQAVEPVLRRGFALPGALAARSVGASLSRTGSATAALTLAFATVIGIGTMTASFRQSFDLWLNQTLLADVYLTDTHGSGTLDDALVDALVDIPGVGGASKMRIRTLPTALGDLELRAQAPGPQGWGLQLTTPATDTALQALTAGRGALVNEPLALRRGFRLGDMLELPTAGGPITLPIVGIYRDYGARGGAALIALTQYREHWRDRGLSGIGLYFDAATPEATEAAVRRALEARAPGVAVQSTVAIKQRSLAIFDRTFRVTEVLRSLAALVAFLGLLGALLAIQLEREREVAVLRTLGLDTPGVRRLNVAQAGLLGFAAALFSMPIGLGLASLLIFVINRRSFGWTMELAFDPGALFGGASLAFAAALLAGAYPALRAARSPPAAALRAD